MAYERKRTSKKGKCSKENPTPFVVSLKSRNLKDTAANSQVQKRLDYLLKNVASLVKVNRKKGL